MEQVVITTADGVRIVGDYYASQSERGVLLLHMMPATRASWREFALRLQERGYQVLAIDLRGHGESDGGPDGYQDFTDAQHQASIHDVEAGVSFLQSKGVSKENLVLIGASIGANLALWYMSDHTDIRQAVLLSAGLNYRSVETLPIVSKLKTGQRVFFATSTDDRPSPNVQLGTFRVVGNAEMNKKLHDAVSAGVEKKLLIYQHAGHGTDLLKVPNRTESREGFEKEEPDLATEIINWLE